MPKILIADDHPLTGLGLGALIKQQLPAVKLKYAYTFQQALDKLVQQPVDLLILDLQIPGGKGVEMIAMVRAIQQDARILIFSARDELINAPEYLQRGAEGFLHKTCEDADALKAVTTILAGRKYVSERVQEHMLHHSSAQLCHNDPTDLLTSRERQVLGLLLSGKWLKEIASELGVEISTVGTQKNRILKKLKVDNLIDLARKIWLYEGSSV